MSEAGGTGLTDLCVVTAVDIEFNAAAGLLVESSWHREAEMKVCRGRSGNRRITILQSGLGAAGFDQQLADHLASNRYDALIVAGLAGGLDPSLRAGDAVLYDRCHDARAEEKPPAPEKIASVACDDWLLGFLLEALRSSGNSCVRGSGVTVNKVIVESKDKLSLGRRYNAAAVDMETYGALAAGVRFDLPVAALRVISDGAWCDLPDVNRAHEAGGRINGWRMAGVMIARPLAAVRFLLGIRRAIRALKINLRAALTA